MPGMSVVLFDGNGEIVDVSELGEDGLREALEQADSLSCEILHCLDEYGGE